MDSKQTQENQEPAGLAAATGSALWQVWFEPTEKGIKAFGWKPAPIGRPLDNLEDAQFECYIARLEEPAPDAGEYGRYVVKPHPPNAERSRPADER